MASIYRGTSGDAAIVGWCEAQIDSWIVDHERRLIDAGGVRTHPGRRALTRARALAGDTAPATGVAAGDTGLDQPTPRTLAASAPEHGPAASLVLPEGGITPSPTVTEP